MESWLSSQHEQSDCQISYTSRGVRGHTPDQRSLYPRRGGQLAAVPYSSSQGWGARGGVIRELEAGGGKQAELFSETHWIENWAGLGGEKEWKLLKENCWHSLVPWWSKGEPGSESGFLELQCGPWDNTAMYCPLFGGPETSWCMWLEELPPRLPGLYSYRKACTPIATSQTPSLKSTICIKIQ